MGNSKSNHLGAQGTVNPEPCYVLLQAPAEPDRNALLRMWVQRFGFALHTTPRQGGTQRYAGKLTSGEPSPEVSRRNIYIYIYMYIYIYIYIYIYL